MSCSQTTCMYSGTETATSFPLTSFLAIYCSCSLPFPPSALLSPAFSLISLDQISQHVETAATEVDHGTQQLGKAKKYKVRIMPVLLLGFSL